MSWRERREALGLTQDELATRAGLSSRTIRVAENEGPISPRTTARLRSALEAADVEDSASLVCPHCHHPLRVVLG